MFKRGKSRSRAEEDVVLIETSNGEASDVSPVEAEFSGEISLLQLILGEGLEISHSCDGNASCGTCRIVVVESKDLPERNQLEQEMADDRGFKSHERLACQVLACKGLKIRIP